MAFPKLSISAVENLSELTRKWKVDKKEKEARNLESVFGFVKKKEEVDKWLIELIKIIIN